MMVEQSTRPAITKILARALVCVSLVLAGSAHAAKMIRYKDENGNTVLSTTIPAERVKYGYDIVDSYGTLLERVPPQLSPEAYAAKVEREKRVAECKKIQDRVRKLYQFESDIDYAEQQGLESIEQSIANIRANLAVATSQREEFEGRAAQLDIAGQAIPNVLLDNIERAKAQEKNLTDEIDKRNGEKLELKKTQQYDRLVFAMDNCDNGLPEQPLELSDYSSNTALANKPH